MGIKGKQSNNHVGVNSKLIFTLQNKVIFFKMLAWKRGSQFVPDLNKKYLLDWTKLRRPGLSLYWWTLDPFKYYVRVIPYSQILENHTTSRLVSLKHRHSISLLVFVWGSNQILPQKKVLTQKLSIYTICMHTKIDKS